MNASASLQRLDAPNPRALWMGLAFWLALGALGIALRGVRWEEGFERAQALLDVVPYPDGHPLRLYAWNAFSIHYYSSALLLKLTDSALLVCGLRNLLCVWGAIAPVYLLASHLARDTRAGHLAALLMLANAHAFFRSYYSNDVWPFMFTSGEMGLAWAFLTVWAMAASRWRLAFFLLGAMPVVHVGQMPPVLALGLACLAFIALGDRAALRPALQGLAVGLVLSAAFLLVYMQLRQPMPDTGGYAPQGDVLDTWKRFTYYEDIHRRPTTPPRFGPFSHSNIGMIAALMLGGLWLCTNRTRPLAVALGYGIICVSAVWIACAAQALLKIDTPYLVIGWLPYRLTNHAAALLLVLAASVAMASRWKLGALAAVAWLAIRPLAALLIPVEYFDRYVVPSEGPLFLLLGACAVVLIHHWKGSRTLPMLIIAAAWAVLATQQQFLAACMLLGIGIEWGGGRLIRLVSPFEGAGAAEGAEAATGDVSRGPARPIAALLAAAGLLAIAGMLHHEFQNRQHLIRSPFEQQMQDWFTERDDPAGLLLAPFWTLNYQEKTGQPVFLTFETPLLTPYIRALGPTIEQMVHDAYGITWGQPWNYDLTLWETRTPEEWQTLSNHYGIRYLLAPASLKINLDKQLVGESLVLYQISSTHR